MESISLFDLVLITVATYGLVFFLGVYAGRAAAWREGLQALLASGEVEEKPKRVRDVPSHVHTEDRRPPGVEEAKGLNGAGSTKVVARRSRAPQDQEEREERY